MFMINNFKDIEKSFQELSEENKKNFLLLANSFFEDIRKKESLLSLKSSFSKNENVNLPPPPPMPNIPSPPPKTSIEDDNNVNYNPLKTRNIVTGPLTFNKPFSSLPNNPNKKKYLSILDSLDYIYPVITETGKEALNPRLMIEADIYKFLKLILNNQLSFKEIYIMEFSNKYNFGKYLEKVYQMSKEKYFYYKKNKNLNENEEVSCRIGELLLELNLINQEQLNLALKIQKGEQDFPTKETTNNNNMILGNIGMNLAQQVMQKISNSNTIQNKPKLLLGNVIVELKYINKEQLDYALGIQRWLKYAIENTK